MDTRKFQQKHHQPAFPNNGTNQEVQRFKLNLYLRWSYQDLATSTGKEDLLWQLTMTTGTATQILCSLLPFLFTLFMIYNDETIHIYIFLIINMHTYIIIHNKIDYKLQENTSWRGRYQSVKRSLINSHCLSCINAKHTGWCRTIETTTGIRAIIPCEHSKELFAIAFQQNRSKSHCHQIVGVGILAPKWPH